MTSALSPTTTQPRLKVDVWSDIACPWCYIGKRRLEAALAQFAHRDRVEVVWHSFELDTSAPVSTPQSAREHLAVKYGTTSEKAQEMQERMTGVAAEEGLDFRFDNLKITNTFQAHQVVHLAAQRGLQGAMKERFFRAYLTEGEQLGDTATLVRLAGEVGLEEDEVRTALEQQTHADAVRADEAKAYAYGISGVPFFVLGEKYGVSGAQSADVLLGALQQVWQEQQPLQLLATPAEDADGCEDGSCALPPR
ncbi:DsbA family oxidoreductase [Deinococcus peraridilitoris]|uniref:DsbA family oxidoreductase n=1 Tax=Deinococcus peraridilitoris TaxID=432329 RepID=UPI000694C86E|nr:DsbA family oxidoreductase [Deinococcus peraridilitoris]